MRPTDPCVERAAVLRSQWCECCTITWETQMTWKTPKIVEVPVGMEINMYACAARK
jgi:coenzyme PQQ precursor peptide PqqA